jgi:hypothetical protein
MEGFLSNEKIQERDIFVRSVHPQEVPRRRSSATPHKEISEDGAEMAERARSH